MRQRPIKIDRQWIGAPDRPWNPTVSLFVVCVGGYGMLSTGWLSGLLPTLPTVIGLALCSYLGFTVMHDAMHGTAHRSKTVGNAMGRICGLMLTLSLPLFYGVHHAHHGHTNEPDRDPDFVVSIGPEWLRPLALIAALPVYRWHFYGSRLWRNRPALYEAIAIDVAIGAVCVWAFTSGYGEVVLTLWLGPVLLAAFWLAFAFDYLPHYPHSTVGRYHDTRCYPGPIANVLLLGQNYHLIHHLWTTIPWYRYQGAFDAIESELRERECAIGWSSRAEEPDSSRSPERGPINGLAVAD